MELISPVHEDLLPMMIPYSTTLLIPPNADTPVRVVPVPALPPCINTTPYLVPAPPKAATFDLPAIPAIPATPAVEFVLPATELPAEELPASECVPPVAGLPALGGLIAVPELPAIPGVPPAAELPALGAVPPGALPEVLGCVPPAAILPSAPPSLTLPPALELLPPNTMPYLFPATNIPPIAAAPP